MNFGRFYNRFNRLDMGLDKLKVTEWHCKLQIECGKLEALHNTFVKQVDKTAISVFSNEGLFAQKK